MIEFLFLDLDDTILDFHKAERIAIARTFQDYGVEPTEAVLNRYHIINKAHWERLERQELTREQVLTGRFQALFQELGIPVEPEAVARDYEKNLAIGHYFLPGVEEAVASLSKQYKLYLASNGTASVQKGRLTSANLYRFFREVFISQEVGYNKPSREYFEACFARIPGFDREKAMMVGDSLTSDIRGGINAGIKTCWYNPRGKAAREDIRPDYCITALNELPRLLEKLFGSLNPTV